MIYEVSLSLNQTSLKLRSNVTQTAHHTE